MRRHLLSCFGDGDGEDEDDDHENDNSWKESTIVVQLIN